MKRCDFLLDLFLAAAFSFCLIANAQAEKSPGGRPTMVLTKVVGEVGDQFVTSREVRINFAIRQAIEKSNNANDAKDVKDAKDGKNASEKDFSIIGAQDANFPAEVGAVLDEWAIYLEAKALLTQPSTRSETAKLADEIMARWSGRGAWTDLEVSSDELKQMVERKMIASSFRKLKTDPQLAPVTDEDALNYYKKNRLRFGSLPFSNFKENIKTFLVKNQTERRLQDWYEVLRRKYKVRNFIAG